MQNRGMGIGQSQERPQPKNYPQVQMQLENQVQLKKQLQVQALKQSHQQKQMLMQQQQVQMQKQQQKMHQQHSTHNNNSQNNNSQNNNSQNNNSQNNNSQNNNSENNNSHHHGAHQMHLNAAAHKDPNQNNNILNVKSIYEINNVPSQAHGRNPGHDHEINGKNNRQLLGSLNMGKKNDKSMENAAGAMGNLALNMASGKNLIEKRNSVINSLARNKSLNRNLF
jgi:hypothetical protein